MLKRVEDVIHTELISAITGGMFDDNKNLISLSVITLLPNLQPRICKFIVDYRKSVKQDQ